VHQVVVIRDRAGRLLVEQRPEGGMWAGLWQFPTREGPMPGLDGPALGAWAGVRRVEEAGSFERMTTHRAVRFQVWRASGPVRLATGGRRWVALDEAEGVALSVPHRRILGRWGAGETQS
jgi:A/G-specific adenine glycosylase